jgi:hypothetical protein
MAVFLQFVFLLALLAFFLFFTIQAFNIIFRGYAPFLSTRKPVVSKVVSEAVFKEDGIAYELGAGTAGFLRAMRQKYPRAKLVGVEYSFWPYWLARFQVAITGTKIEMVKKNIFQVGVKDADLIYCYLNVETMERLEKMFREECKPGAQVVSYQFPLPHLPTAKVIELGRKLGKLYFYNF